MIDENKIITLTYKQKREVRNIIIYRCFRNTFIVLFIFLCVVDYYCNNKVSIFADLLMSFFLSIFISDIWCRIAFKKIFETEKGLNKIVKKGWIKIDDEMEE